MQKEIFKGIKGFEGFYEISNLGNVKSLDRQVKYKSIGIKNLKGKIKSKVIGKNGYYAVSLFKNNICKLCNIHQLVAIAFLNHTPNGFKLVVNHINFNKLDNRVENLEIVTNRENSNRKHLQSSSKYTGVTWNKNAKKWRSNITVKGKLIHLGYFTNEIDASNAYQKEFIKLR